MSMIDVGIANKIIHLIIFALLVFAAFKDIVTREIENWVSVCILLLALFSLLAVEFPVQHLMVWISISIISLVAFYGNVFGGADAKLFIATAPLFSWETLVIWLFAVSIFLGATAILFLIYWKVKEIIFNRKVMDKYRTIPVAVPIVFAYGVMISISQYF